MPFESLSVMKNHHIIFFIFTLLITSLTASVFAGNILARGASLTADSNFLTSPDSTFTCGFYSFGANAYWFSIWFTNSVDKTVVWTANRDNPVNREKSRMSLRKNGALVLTDFDGSTAWMSNTTSVAVDRAELLDSGNFVIIDDNGKIVWQSFDYPTDTLLPTQHMTNQKKLNSNKGPKNFGAGDFCFFFDSDNVLKMLYDGPEITSIYWPNPAPGVSVFDYGRTNYNSTRIAFLDKTGRFNSSDQMQFTAVDVGVGIKRRLTMDYDGNLRAYSLNDSSGMWLITWQAISTQCDVHGLCGRNGICTYTPQPRCSCPPNYEQTDPTNWSKGCKPKFKRGCFDSHFVELSHTDYYGFDLNYSQSVSFQACKQLCLDDCRCQAFSYRLLGQGLCFTKSALFNGFRSVDFPASLYLRVPESSEPLDHVILNGSGPECSNGRDKIVLLPALYDVTNQRIKWVYPYSFVLAIGILEVVVFVAGWWFLFRKHGTSSSMEDGYRAISSQFRSFSYSELRKATGNFKEILGVGGFGSVYKGVLSDDDRVVAVKKLAGDVVQGEEEFWAEVSTIGRINHMNLARMWGFCSKGKHRLLVYEYVENGSLDKHLFPVNGILGWNERFKVAFGTAKGLAYLHHECLEWVIHCDVKPENILLDKDFEPKISDFGLAKLCQRGGIGHGTSELTKIRGTKGYMAPEWAMNLPITAKVDVYSYGVVILELVKGIRLSNWVVDNDVVLEGVSQLANLVKLARSKVESEDDSWVRDFVDPKLEGRFSRKQAALMIKVGLSCVEEDRNKRPNMESITQVFAECEDETIHCLDNV
ncbi:hypothetical protein vseg_020594 [Gypsophila vaccaria]